MANIIQAARWLMEGHDTRRVSDENLRWLTPYYPDKTTFAVVDVMGNREILMCADIIADDWEIAE